MKQIDFEMKAHLGLNSEHFNLHGSLLSLAPREFALANGIVDLFDQYKQLYDVEDECFLLDRKMENTQEVERLDRERDTLFNFFYRVANMAAELPIASAAEAGATLADMLVKFKDTARLPYLGNSGNIKEFLSQMELAKYASACQALHLDTIISTLAQTQTQFDDVFLARSGEYRAKKTNETMKTIRPQVDAAARAYFQAINALYQVNELVTKNAAKRAEFDAVIDPLNDIIFQFKAYMATRQNNPIPNGDPENAASNPAQDNTPAEGEGGSSEGEPDEPGTPSEPSTPSTPSDDDNNPGGGNDGSDMGGFMG